MARRLNILLLLILLVNPDPPRFLLPSKALPEVLYRLTLAYQLAWIGLLFLGVGIIFVHRRQYWTDWQALIRGEARIVENQTEAARTIGLVGVGLAVAVFIINHLYLWWIIPAKLSIDGPSYLDMALQWLSARNFAGYHFRTPGYPLFLSLFLNHQGALNLSALAMVQTLMLIVAAVMFYYGLVYLFRFKRGLAWLASLMIFSLFPLAALSKLAATETLALFLMTGLMVLHFILAAKKAPVLFGLEGALCGLLALVRPQFYFVAFLMFLGHAAKKQWKGAAVFLVAAAVLQGGWVWRNLTAYHLPYPASAVALGYREQIVDPELCRHLDFGPQADPAQVETLRHSAAQDDREQRLGEIVDSAIRGQWEQDPKSQEARTIQYLKATLLTAFRTTEGRRTYLRLVLRNVWVNLGIGSGYWESPAAVQVSEHHPAYWYLFGESLPKALYGLNPWLFIITSVIVLYAAFQVVVGKNDEQDLLPVILLWSIIAVNAVLCALGDVPVSPRYGIGVVVLYPWLYLLAGRLVLTVIRKKLEK